MQSLLKEACTDLICRTVGAERLLISPPVIENLDAREKSATKNAERLYAGNKSFGQATQILGDLGAQERESISSVEYRNNEAHDESVQILGNVNSADMLQALLHWRS